ncbi:MAG: hypothetical protein ABSH36_10445 [Solirubrobacteraceae bacterium]
MIAKRDLSGRLVRVVAGSPIQFDTAFPEQWTVHVHERCHRRTTEDGTNIQRAADNAANQLERLLSKAQSLTMRSPEHGFKVIDRYVLRAFESGRYSVALFLNEAVRAAREKRDELDVAAQILTFQLSARAGVRGKKPLALDKFTPIGTRIDARAMLHVANHQSNVGQFAAARRTLARAQAELRSSSELDLDLALRRAQIDRGATDAQRALDIAERSNRPYRRNTALVIAGFIDLAAGASSAQDNFEAVLDLSNRVSWLYRAECWFGLGIVALNAHRPTLAYRYLIAAQYVYGFLGLQAMPHPCIQTSDGNPVSLPFHLLQSDRLASLSRAHCMELRRQAISGGLLREWLTDELGGFHPTGIHPPDPVRHT